MNKGCLIAAISVVVLLILCCGGTSFFAFTNAGPFTLALLEMDIARYQELHPDTPIEPSPDAWAEALSAPDSGVSQQQLWKQLSEQSGGRLADPFGTPIRIVVQADGTISAFMDGKDGLPGTADDVTSEKFREFVKQAK